MRKKWIGLTIITFTGILSACNIPNHQSKISDNLIEEKPLQAYSGDSLEQKVKNKQREFLKKLPHCEPAELNPNAEIIPVNDIVTNCKIEKAKGKYISGIGGMKQSYSIVSGRMTLRFENDIYNDNDYKKAFCTTSNRYGEDHLYGYYINLEETELIKYKFLLPLLKRITTIVDKGFINNVFAFNYNIGDIRMYGGKKFHDIPDFGYQEYGSGDNHHYAIIGSRDITNEEGKTYYSKILIIDDKAYALGDREYIGKYKEGIKKSPREFVKFDGNKAIIKRMKNGTIISGYNDENLPELGGYYTNYDLETCEIPLTTTSKNYMNENEKLSSLGYKEKITTIGTGIKCEQPGYYENLTEKKLYTLLLNKETGIYETIIPELCAKISTIPENISNGMDGVQDSITLLLSGNTIIEGKRMERNILEFNNKPRNKTLLKQVNEEALRTNNDCKLISGLLENIKKNKPDQAEIFSYLAPGKQEKYKIDEEDYDICQVRTTKDKQGYGYKFIQYDEKYPGIYVYFIDRGGELGTDKDLNISFIDIK